jgi:hypothetical protein
LSLPGPTIDFAASLRGHKKNEGPCKQAIWNNFFVRRTGNEPSKVVELSQKGKNWAPTPNLLRICLDQYRPKERDRQHYSWFDGGVEQLYHTPPYGIEKENEASTTHALENFLRENAEDYLRAHLKNATEITRKTFRIAQEHKVGFLLLLYEGVKSVANMYQQHLPLVERALKLWVGCRFIEEPWSIVGEETLGRSPHPHPNCPYHDRIPIPSIVDQQIDLIVINDILQLEFKKILNTLKTMLESKDPWNKWFEIYFANFILLHNVELAMAHDAWFVKRNNLKVSPKSPYKHDS